MKKNGDLRFYILTTVTLLFISILSYSLQIYLFHHESDTFFYFFQDLSFVPIQVLIVTFFIDRLLKRQQRISILKKVNVSIGIFYNELGNELLKLCFDITSNKELLQRKLDITAKWDSKKFARAERWINTNPAVIDVTRETMVQFKQFLDSKRIFLLNLLESSNLSEHDTFTDTLLSVCHLSDELALRKDLASIPQADIAHLVIDIRRAYHGIIREWILYMNHISGEYPFLFSLALRSNPFSDRTSVVIEE